MENLGLQAPWITYYNKIKAIFADDPDIEVLEPSEEVDEEGNFDIVLRCINGYKAYALCKLLTPQVDMGNVTVCVRIEDINSDEDEATLLKAAFTGNPHFEDVVVQGLDGQGPGATYCVMKKEVIQFFNDDLTDVNRNYSGLAEDILREITMSPDVKFCTSNM